MSFERLLGAADRVVPGLELNRVLFEIREEVPGATVGYEVVLDGMRFEDFLTVSLPKLTEHYLAKRLTILGGPNLFVTLWKDDHAHLFIGGRINEALCDILEVDEQGLTEKLIALRTRAGLEPNPWAAENPRHAQLLLGGPE